jgi:hypothetical protein
MTKKAEKNQMKSKTCTEKSAFAPNRASVVAMSDLCGVIVLGMARASRMVAHV